MLDCTKKNIFYFAPLEQWLAEFVARYLAIINCSITFIIYCVVESNFRKDLTSFFRRKKGVDPRGVPSPNKKNKVTSTNHFSVKLRPLLFTIYI